MEIRGSTAVVTGASSGIGAATALELARKGARVVLVARRRDRLEQAADACRSHAPESVAHVADVADRGACEAVVADAVDRFGSVDILVNNAGISLHRDAAKTTVEEIHRVMDVNFFGAVSLTMAALPLMLERRSGSIINVTSVAGYVPNPKESAYGASKAALARWSHGLNLELHGTGVHVGVLSPGPIDTEIWYGEGEEPYNGKLYAPSLVAEAAVGMIERQVAHLTVPRHFGLVGALYPLLARPMRWGSRRFSSRMLDEPIGPGSAPVTPKGRA